jgi:hypothetical protein
VTSTPQKIYVRLKTHSGEIATVLVADDGVCTAEAVAVCYDRPNPRLGKNRKTFDEMKTLANRHDSKTRSAYGRTYLVGVIGEDHARVLHQSTEVRGFAACEGKRKKRCPHEGSFIFSKQSCGKLRPTLAAIATVHQAIHNIPGAAAMSSTRSPCCGASAITGRNEDAL